MFTISRDMTSNKIKTEVKATVIEFLIEALREKYGEDSVKMIRTGNSSKVNEIGFIFDEATSEDGEVNSIVVSLNPSVKEFSNHTSDKGKVFVPFEFLAAAADYDDWVEEKRVKAEAAEKTKAEKKAKNKTKKSEED